MVATVLLPMMVAPMTVVLMMAELDVLKALLRTVQVTATVHQRAGLVTVGVTVLTSHTVLT
tara:strand:- start:257 stop:439 length:183 start_codon:yes stop_codon:yes gene_type:complete